MAFLSASGGGGDLPGGGRAITAFDTFVASGIAAQTVLHLYGLADARDNLLILDLQSSAAAALSLPPLLLQAASRYSLVFVGASDPGARDAVFFLRSPLWLLTWEALRQGNVGRQHFLLATPDQADAVRKALDDLGSLGTYIRSVLIIVEDDSLGEQLEALLERIRAH